MYIILTVIHIIVGLALILIVLLQTGKGASMGAAFGGSSQTIFGARGAGSFLGKLTTGAAVVFMLTSLTLAFLSSRGAKSSIILREETTQTEVEPEKAGQTPGASEVESQEDGSEEGKSQPEEMGTGETDQTSKAPVGESEG